MRRDIFQSRKCVHVKLDKEVHAALRAKLFRHGISMQEVFDEFARLVAEGNTRASGIVDSLVARGLREAIDGHVSKRKKHRESFGELDSESLYNLINGNDNDAREKDPESDEVV